MIIDIDQIRKLSLPTAPATWPIENNTSAGTPLATQKAPFQSIERRSLLDSPAVWAARLTPPAEIQSPSCKRSTSVA
jgi:hypothetical protein